MQNLAEPAGTNLCGTLTFISGESVQKFGQLVSFLVSLFVCLCVSFLLSLLVC